MPVGKLKQKQEDQEFKAIYPQLYGEFVARLSYVKIWLKIKIKKEK